MAFTRPAVQPGVLADPHAMIRVAVVEDDKEILDSLTQLLAGDEDIAIINTYQSAEAYLSAFPALEVDVVLMDTGLPKKSGIQIITELKPLRPTVQYLICTIHEDDDQIFQALCAGATGYLLKNASAPEISNAIKIVYHGGSMMSATIARKVVQSLHHRQLQSRELHHLTPRQWEILHLLDQGYRYKEIAEKMNLSFETIRTYCRNIYEILQVHSRTDALNKVFPKK